MTILVKNATICFPHHQNHNLTTDILIESGKIAKLENNITEKKEYVIIKGKDLRCIPSLCDIGTHSGQPGRDDRETIESLTKCAVAGGYGVLAIMPNVSPITQSESTIKYFTQNQYSGGVKLLPIAALSEDLNGKNITESIDLHNSGAIAFSDGLQSITDNSLLLRALDYAKHTNLPILHFPRDPYLSMGSDMHEAKISTSLGLKGEPDMAEYQIIQRDIALNNLANGKLIIHGISSGKSVELIKKAKSQQNKLFATTPFLNLIYTDDNLIDFDSNFKLLPVLRESKDKEALLAGVKEGIIDAVISNHKALDEESKKLEFPYAKPGSLGLETVLISLLSLQSKKLPLERIVEVLSINPRTILNILIPSIEIGSIADITIVDCGESFTYASTKSKSSNSAQLGITFNAMVKATLLGESAYIA